LIPAIYINSVLSSKSYRIGSILIDPGDEWEGFENVDAVLLTHAHFDHIYGLNRVVELNPEVKIFTNTAGQEALLNDRLNMSRYHETPFVLEYPENIIPINDGDEIDLGNGLIAKAIFTPGHNPSCITWIIGDAVFTGDSYIPGIKTVTNLPHSNKSQAIESEKLIIKLCESRTIFSGHKTE